MHFWLESKGLAPCEPHVPPRLCMILPCPSTDRFSPQGTGQQTYKSLGPVQNVPKLPHNPIIWIDDSHSIQDCGKTLHLCKRGIDSNIFIFNNIHNCPSGSPIAI